MYKVEFDILGREVFSKRNSILYRAGKEKGKIVIQELFDLSEMEFEEMEAPKSAKICKK